MNPEPPTFDKGDAYYRNIRTELIALAPDIHGRVLEIGCAEGYTMAYLQERFNCSVVGLDYCEEALCSARDKGLDVYACDLNSADLPFGFDEFDYIIIGDVLEHLYDPWGVLRKIVHRLKGDGTILLSIPNVKHYTLLKELILHDRWDYCSSGILDSSHLRFFTLDGIQKLVRQSGVEIFSLEYSCFGSEFIWLLNRICRNRLHSFLVVQYLVAARKIPAE